MAAKRSELASGVRDVSSPTPLLEAGLDSPGRARWTNGAKGICMDGYAVAHVDEIGELDDGRAPMRAVRHHFGITSFGINAWIAREAGARIINEHDEATNPVSHR
jgi:hypothetical protein